MKRSSIDDAIFFSTYEEFQVYESLSKAITSPLQVCHPLTLGTETIFTDIYAPKGIPKLGLDGGTIIEIKRFLSYSAVKNVERIFKVFGSEYNVLVVYISGSVSNAKDSSNSEAKKLVYKSLSEITRTSKNDDNKFYSKRSQANWKELRTKTIERAHRIVVQSNNVLFLGAGVSMSANMPSWSQLLNGLMGEVKRLNPTTLDAFKELHAHIYEECGESYLIMARYLETAIKLGGSNYDFSQLIQKYLYSTPHTSKLLEIIASIIVQKKVSEVVTYNFDDILEQELTKQGLVDSEHFTSIAKDAEIKGHNTLPIYHVHGIIPENGPADVVVFSEEEYHKRYSDIYHWSNVEQLHALSRKHCFFIGLSMTDPNLRRLLDTARRMNQANGDCHFAFLRRTKLENYCVTDKPCKYVHVSESLIDKKKQKEIYDLNYSVIERIFNNLGVQIIWYEDFDELPEIISDVFNTHPKGKTIEETITDIESSILKLSDIESNVPKWAPHKNSLVDIATFLKYKSENGETYRHLVYNIGDTLSLLSSEVIKDLEINDIKELQELQASLPEYSNNMAGYADFYKIWLEAIKALNDRNKPKDKN
jgi:hypothetical protein